MEALMFEGRWYPVCQTPKGKCNINSIPPIDTETVTLSRERFDELVSVEKMEEQYSRMLEPFRGADVDPLSTLEMVLETANKFICNMEERRQGGEGWFGTLNRLIAEASEATDLKARLSALESINTDLREEVQMQTAERERAGGELRVSEAARLDARQEVLDTQQRGRRYLDTIDALQSQVAGLEKDLSAANEALQGAEQSGREWEDMAHGQAIRIAELEATPSPDAIGNLWVAKSFHDRMVNAERASVGYWKGKAEEIKTHATKLMGIICKAHDPFKTYLDPETALLGIIEERDELKARVAGLEDDKAGLLSQIQGMRWADMEPTTITIEPTAAPATSGLVVVEPGSPDDKMELVVSAEYEALKARLQELEAKAAHDCQACPAYQDLGQRAAEVAARVPALQGRVAALEAELAQHLEVFGQVKKALANYTKPDPTSAWMTVLRLGEEKRTLEKQTTDLCAKAEELAGNQNGLLDQIAALKRERLENQWADLESNPLRPLLEQAQAALEASELRHARRDVAEVLGAKVREAALNSFRQIAFNGERVFFGELKGNGWVSLSTHYFERLLRIEAGEPRQEIEDLWGLCFELERDLAWERDMREIGSRRHDKEVRENQERLWSIRPKATELVAKVALLSGVSRLSDYSKSELVSVLRYLSVEILAIVEVHFWEEIRGQMLPDGWDEGPLPDAPESEVRP